MLQVVISMVTTVECSHAARTYKSIASLLWEPEGGVLGMGMSQEVKSGYMK